MNLTHATSSAKAPWIISNSSSQKARKPKSVSFSNFVKTQDLQGQDVYSHAASLLLSLSRQKMNSLNKSLAYLKKLHQQLEGCSYDDLCFQIEMDPYQENYLHFIQYTYKNFLESAAKTSREPPQVDDTAFYQWVGEQKNELETLLQKYAFEPRLLQKDVPGLRLQELQQQMAYFVVEQVQKVCEELGETGGREQIKSQSRERVLNACSRSREILAAETDFLQTVMPALSVLKNAWKEIHQELLLMQMEGRPLSLDPIPGGARNIDGLEEMISVLPSLVLLEFTTKMPIWYSENSEKAKEFADLCPLIFQVQVLSVAHRLDQLEKKRTGQLLPKDFDSFYEERMAPLTQEVFEDPFLMKIAEKCAIPLLKRHWQKVHDSLIQMQNSRKPLHFSSASFREKLPSNMQENLLQTLLKKEPVWAMEKEENPQVFLDQFRILFNRQSAFLTEKLKDIDRWKKFPISFPEVFETFYQKLILPAAIEKIWEEYSPPLGMAPFAEALVQMGWDSWDQWAAPLAKAE